MRELLAAMHNEVQDSEELRTASPTKMILEFNPEGGVLYIRKSAVLAGMVG